MEHVGATSAPRRHSGTPRGSSVTGSESSNAHDEVARVTPGQAKYRNPRPPRTLNRLPRGFVWTDPDEQLAEEPPDREEVQVASRFFHVRVPENTVYLVERGGIFHRVLNPGIRILVPGLDKVAYIFSKKMQKLVFATSNVPTAENVLLTVKGTIYYVVDEPVPAAYAVEDMKEALVDLAAAAVHEEFGRVSVDAIFSDLEYLWGRIAQTINDSTCLWGTRCLRFSTEIALPKDLSRTYNELVQVRLQQQIDETRAENESRARDFNTEAANREIVNQSEYRNLVTHNDAQADADAIVLKGEANAGALNAIADALERPSGRDAARVWIAAKYIDALSLGLKNNSGTVSIDASGPSKIVDEALNIMETHLRSRNNSRIQSPVESSVSPPSPQQARQASPAPPGYTRPAPPSPAPHSTSSHERRSRPRRVRPQGHGAGTSQTVERDLSQDAPGSGVAYFRSKLDADSLPNVLGTVAPSNGTKVPPPSAAKEQPVSPRLSANEEVARSPVKDKSRLGSKSRNIWMSHVSEAEAEAEDIDTEEKDGVGPAIDITLSEVRAEAVSASALAGWSDVSRRTRRPNPDVSRKTSKRSVPRSVPLKQHSNTTVDTDGEEPEALTRKMSAAPPPRRPSLEFRKKRSSVSSLPKRQSGKESRSRRGTGSDGAVEGYTEAM